MIIAKAALLAVLLIAQVALGESQASSDALLAGYQRAAAVQAYEPNGMFRNLEMHARWIEGHDSFWYKRETEGGHEFVLVDAAKGSKSLAFNHGKVPRSRHGQGRRCLMVFSCLIIGA